MVCRINNTTRRYYDYLKASGKLPLSARSIALPDELPAEWDAIKCPPPVISAAQKILLHRLKIVDDITFELDGEPACIKEIVDAANRYVRKMGGQYICYPGLRPNHQDGLTMKITNYKEELPCK